MEVLSVIDLLQVRWLSYVKGGDTAYPPPEDRANTHIFCFFHAVIEDVVL